MMKSGKEDPELKTERKLLIEREQEKMQGWGPRGKTTGANESRPEDLDQETLQGCRTR
jgi:hypothetical protein